MAAAAVAPCTSPQSPVEGYEAVVRMWVTKADYDAGFDAALYKWVTSWIRKT